jgi:hypothetical protein
VLNAREFVGTHDVLFVTLAAGLTPNLAAVLPDGRWEERHSPGTFTLASHQAFFAGFLPTPRRPGKHPRLFAARFAASETTAPTTWAFDEPDLVSALAAQGYRTICIGGVGFFNKRTALGRVLPSFFQESHWHPDMGVTSRESTERQVELAARILAGVPREQRVFLFVNVSALHQPSSIFVPGATRDSVETQTAALAYVDRHLPGLFDAVRRRGPALTVLCSDHGTAFGEDGYAGHRLSHPVVWTVPYAELLLEPVSSAETAPAEAAIAVGAGA